jgi:Polysaccharide pyruvyl transferase
MKVLVAGWFSFEKMGATAGDLLARDLVCEWLEEAGRSYDIAHAPPFNGGVDWRSVDPGGYSEVVFVCGPFGNGWPITEFLPRFASSRLIGLNLTMFEPLERWNPFQLLLERDSSTHARPDVSFLSRGSKVPVVGVVLVHPQIEYEDGLHEAAAGAVERLLGSVEAAPLEIDTRLDANRHGLRTAAQVESLIARTDVVITTRLHGLVLALKNGIPALAIDPIKSGAKVTRQAEVLGWPYAFAADSLSDGDLRAAFESCLTDDARAAAREAARRASLAVTSIHREFVSAFAERI